LCWNTAGKYTNSMFLESSGSKNPSSAKCACISGEYYDGSTCALCPTGQVSYGKTELCVERSAVPSAFPTLAPTNLTMDRITEISGSYISSASVWTEYLSAKEIMLDGVALSSHSRRLTSACSELQGVVEGLRTKIEEMHSSIETLRAGHEAQQAEFLNLQKTMMILHDRNSMDSP